MSACASTVAAGTSARRTSISLPGYALGDVGRTGHFAAEISRDVATAEARGLAVGDGAFVLRSDQKWAYAVVTARVGGENPTLTFAVDGRWNCKTLPAATWGKYVRVIRVPTEVALLERVEAESKRATEELRRDLGSWFCSGMFRWKSEKPKVVAATARYKVGTKTPPSGDEERDASAVADVDADTPVREPPPPEPELTPSFDSDHDGLGKGAVACRRHPARRPIAPADAQHVARARLYGTLAGQGVVVVEPCPMAFRLVRRTDEISGTRGCEAAGGEHEGCRRGSGGSRALLRLEREWTDSS